MDKEIKGEPTHSSDEETIPFCEEEQIENREAKYYIIKSDKEKHMRVHGNLKVVQLLNFAMNERINDANLRKNIEGKKVIRKELDKCIFECLKIREKINLKIENSVSQDKKSDKKLTCEERGYMKPKKDRKMKKKCCCKNRNKISFTLGKIQKLIYVYNIHIDY